MIRGQDYSEAKGWANPADVFRVGAAIEERYRNARVRAGDLLMTIVGYCGHVEEVPAWLDGANLTQTTARIAIDDGRADSVFCKYMLQSKIGASQVAGSLKGAAQPGLNCGDIEKFLVPLPTRRAEQRAIAEALSDVDALLSGLDRLIAKKRDLKRAAMQQLLTGQTRLPGFHGEWVVTTFAQTVRHQSGNSTLIKGKLSAEPAVGLYPGFSASGQDVWCDHFDYEGDAVIVSAVGSRCGKAFMAAGRWCAIANTHVIWSIPSKIDLHFLGFFINDESFWLKSGSGQPFVLFKQTFAKTLRLPPIPEQTAIGQVLSDLDAELAVLEARREKTRQLKQGMMQELLTGRTRLV